MTSKEGGTELGADTLKELFAASSAKDKSKLDLSKEETDKFSKVRCCAMLCAFYMHPNHALITV